MISDKHCTTYHLALIYGFKKWQTASLWHIGPQSGILLTLIQCVPFCTFFIVAGGFWGATKSKLHVRHYAQARSGRDAAEFIHKKEARMGFWAFIASSLAWHFFVHAWPPICPTVWLQWRAIYRLDRWNTYGNWVTQCKKRHVSV